MVNSVQIAQTPRVLVLVAPVGGGEEQSTRDYEARSEEFELVGSMEHLAACTDLNGNTRGQKKKPDLRSTRRRVDPDRARPDRGDSGVAAAELSA
jgi:hypothetical protein